MVALDFAFIEHYSEMMSRYLPFSLALVGLGSFFIPLVALADGPTVVINEIMWAGTEYVELYNNTGADIDVGNWHLIRQAPDGSATNDKTIPVGKIIAAGGYFLLTSSGGDTTLSPVNLVDVGELLVLKDSTGQVIDTANQQGAWFAGKNPSAGDANDVSMERNSPGSSGTSAGSWHDSTGVVGSRFGTPKAANSSQSVNNAPTAVLTGPSSGNVNTSLSFSAEDSTDSDGNALTFSWSFGDGGVATGATVTHSFVSANTYTVEVTVSDGSLSAIATKSVTVVVPVYSTAVVVNEFLPNPTGTDTNNEFIELFNTGDTVVDLSGWQLDDMDGGSSVYVFPAGTTIAAHGFLVTFNNTSHITLNNDGDTARLVSPDGAVKSSHVYTTSLNEGVSVNRLADGTYVLSTTVTPNAANVITAASAPVASVEPDVVYSRTIKINEVLPDPDGSDSSGEYIEVKNVGSEAVSLSGWQLDDGAGGSSPYTLSAVSLAAGEIKYWLSSTTHLSLSNSGDTVRILDPNGETADSFSYTASDEGVSWNRIDDGTFAASTTLTPGAANVITAPSDTSESKSATTSKKTTSTGKVAGTSVTSIDLDQVRTLKDGTIVNTQGVVSAPPNVVGSNILYVAGSGIRVVLPKTFKQKLLLGDVIQLTGQLGTSYTERRILVQAVGNVSKVKSGPAPTPHEVNTGEINSSWEGSLVHVNGAISRLEGSTIYIDDGSGEVRVVIADATGITRPKLKKGIQADIIGVVSRTAPGYRILPRFQTDISFGAAATALKPIKASKPRATAKPAGRISAEAAATCAPVPSAAPVACSTNVTVVHQQLDSRWVFLGCLLAMGFLIRGFQTGEPLLAGQRAR
jgi:hypothetical protein